MAAALQEQLGQPFVVENRPGADSAIAAEQVSKMAADGYTLMFASNSAMTAAVALRKSPTYDPLKDFTPISMVGRATVFFYVHPDVPGENAEGIHRARKSESRQARLRHRQPAIDSLRAAAHERNGDANAACAVQGRGPAQPGHPRRARALLVPQHRQRSVERERRPPASARGAAGASQPAVARGADHQRGRRAGSHRTPVGWHLRPAKPAARTSSRASTRK